MQANRWRRIDPQRALNLALETELPRLLEFTTRRIALVQTETPRDLISRTLAEVQDPAQQRAMLEGLAAALRGERTVSMPKGWERVETRSGKRRARDSGAGAFVVTEVRERPGFADIARDVE
jgi:hypothetical protein